MMVVLRSPCLPHKTVQIGLVHTRTGQIQQRHTHSDLIWQLQAQEAGKEGKVPRNKRKKTRREKKIKGKEATANSLANSLS